MAAGKEPLLCSKTFSSQEPFVSREIKVNSQFWWCHKCTRLKFIGVVCILLMAFVYILYKACSLQHRIVLDGVFTVPMETTPSMQLIGGNGRIRYKHTKRRLPQCIIIGSRKSGTRALLTFLNLHPSLLTAKNEVHFFDDEENYMLGLEWYRKRMPYTFADQITIEKTPAYFVCDEVPERVFYMNKSVKLLLIVRDPVERAISDYLQIHMNKVHRNKPDKTFEEYVIDPYSGEIDRTFNPIKRSMYYRHLMKWLKWFPLEQILIVSGENLVLDPAKELRAVETFLGIDHRISKDFFYFNASRGFYCIRNDTGDKCLSSTKGRQHPYVDPMVLRKLRDFFRPHNQDFYKLVGRDFGWP